MRYLGCPTHAQCDLAGLVQPPLLAFNFKHFLHCNSVFETAVQSTHKLLPAQQHSTMSLSHLGGSNSWVCKRCGFADFVYKFDAEIWGAGSSFTHFYHMGMIRMHFSADCAVLLCVPSCTFTNSFLYMLVPQICLTTTLKYLPTSLVNYNQGVGVTGWYTEGTLFGNTSANLKSVIGY